MILVWDSLSTIQYGARRIPVMFVAQDKLLRGSIIAEATLAGTLLSAKTILGTIIAEAELSGTATQYTRGSGTIAATSLLSGDLYLGGHRVELLGTIAPQADLAATMDLRRKIAGIIAGEAGAVPRMKLLQAMAGLAEALADVSGDIQLRMSLTGAVVAEALLRGDMVGTARRWELIEAVSLLTTSLDLPSTITPSLTAASQIN